MLRVAPVALVVSSESNSSCRVCRAALFDKLDTAKMHGLDTSNVSSRVETWRAKWNLGFSVRVWVSAHIVFAENVIWHRVAGEFHRPMYACTCSMYSCREVMSWNRLFAEYLIRHRIAQKRLNIERSSLVEAVHTRAAFVTKPGESTSPASGKWAVHDDAKMRGGHVNPL